jgi:hypothetical protein
LCVELCFPLAASRQITRKWRLKCLEWIFRCNFQSRNQDK